jgi:hypothetical protein
MPVNRRKIRLDRQSGAPGLGIDAYGGQVIDPTKNVSELVDAAILRIDDMAVLRGQVVDEQVRRMYDNQVWLEKFSLLRAQHNQEVRKMESDRVDKIRSVDVANAANTATQLLSAVTNLATTNQNIAETLRNQVATTAAATQTAFERVINPLQERVTSLEKSTNIGAGRAGVSDPAMTELIAEVKGLAKSGAVGTGKTEGISLSWGILVGVIGLAVGLIAIWSFTTRPAVPATPQVVYLPAPAAAK